MDLALHKLNKSENEIKKILNASSFVGEADITTKMMNSLQVLKERMKNINGVLRRG